MREAFHRGKVATPIDEGSLPFRLFEPLASVRESLSAAAA
jgi:hypothetical protein